MTSTPPPLSLEDAIARLRPHDDGLGEHDEALLLLLHGANGALSADEVHARLPQLDVATVYRMLADLEAVGIVQHRHYAHGPACYRWAGAESLPIVCEECGHVVELGPVALEALATKADEFGMTLLPGHFALAGRCAECTARLGPAA